jgi:hypothetical protein
METFLSQQSNWHGLAKWPTGLPVKSLRLSNIEQRSLLQRCKLMFHRVACIAGDGECCASVFRGSGRMPAYRSIPEFDLSEKYHQKAVRCERCAKNASDQTTEQEWQQLAAQWHSMADQAAKLQGDNNFESLRSNSFDFDSDLSKTHDSNDLSS